MYGIAQINGKHRVMLVPPFRTICCSYSAFDMTERDIVGESITYAMTILIEIQK